MNVDPTVGRVVYFTPSHGDSHITKNGQQPLAAIVAAVWSPSCVNLAVFDANAQTTARTSVPFLQADEAKPVDGYYATWMPYQVAQAAKEEAKTFGAKL